MSDMRNDDDGTTEMNHESVQSVPTTNQANDNTATVGGAMVVDHGNEPVTSAVGMIPISTLSSPQNDDTNDDDDNDDDEEDQMKTNMTQNQSGNGITDETEGIGDSPTSFHSKTESLATTYGKRPSRFLLLSLLINVALLIYAHVGLSAVVLSSIERVESTTESGNGNNTNRTGACTNNESDLDRWYNTGGSVQKSIESSYCGTKYGGSGCLTDEECTIECFVTMWNYTQECATCFGSIPLCSLRDGCAVVCQINNGVNEECQTCTKSCNEIFLSCSGFTFVDDVGTSNSSTTSVTNNTNSDDTPTISTITSTSTNEEICAAQQTNVSYTEDAEELYIVYELKFFSAVQRAWTSNAKLLAIIVVLFSGVWPYTKNCIMCYIWYYHTITNDTDQHDAVAMYRQRHAMILWLKRLGKWSFVDVYIIVLILIGLTLQISLNNGTVPLILKGEPRHAIIAFLFATIWSFIHLEVVNEYHIHQWQKLFGKHSVRTPPLQQEKECSGVDSMHDNETNKDNEITPTTTTNVSQHQHRTINVYDTLRIYPWRNAANTPSLKFRNVVVGRMLLLVLYISTMIVLLMGSIYDVVHFTSYISDADLTTTNEPGCIRAYNIYTLGTMMVSNFFLYNNSALPGVYILFIAYVLFVIVSHILVHSIHLAILLFQNIPQQALLCRLADVCWTYASVEVLLLGIFAVQYKFEELVAALAGNDGSQFFGMRSDLREGFFILIGYSVLGSTCHYIFQCVVIEYYHVHPFQRLRNTYGARSWCGFLFVEQDEM